MKTCIDISDRLLQRAKRLARERNTSVRALVEEGLRIITSSNKNTTRIKPKLLTFGGDGVTEEAKARGFTFDYLREEIYRGHGS